MPVPQVGRFYAVKKPRVNWGFKTRSQLLDAVAMAPAFVHRRSGAPSEPDQSLMIGQAHRARLHLLGKQQGTAVYSCAKSQHQWNLDTGAA
jgi:hypothetical protein